AAVASEGHSRSRDATVPSRLAAVLRPDRRDGHDRPVPRWRTSRTLPALRLLPGAQPAQSGFGTRRIRTVFGGQPAVVADLTQGLQRGAEIQLPGSRRAPPRVVGELHMADAPGQGT